MAQLLVVLSTVAACSSPSAEPSASSAAPTTPPPTSESPSGSPGVERIQMEGGGPLAIAVADGALWVASYDTSSVSRVDPETAAEVDTIELDSNPAFLLSTKDRLWVASYGTPEDARVSWIDLPSGEVGPGFHPPDLCCNLATDGRDIWGLDPRGWVLRFDGATGRAVQRFATTINRNLHSNLVFAAGAVWVSSDDSSLNRIDPDTGSLTQAPTHGGIPFAVADGMIWGATPDEIWVVDAGTAEVVRRIPIPNSNEVLWLSVDDDAIWLAIRHPGNIGAVIRMDRQSGEVTNEVPMGTPAFVVSAFGSAWAVDYDTSELVKISG